MTGSIAPAQYGHESSGADGKAIGTAIQPGAPKPVNDVPDDDRRRGLEGHRPAVSRQVSPRPTTPWRSSAPVKPSVRVPFRLDIAPGSTVKVENEGEQYIEDDPLGAPFYAHVARVSLAVDGEQPSIGTSFHLSHIRSEKENGDDRTSVAKHPLYKDTFAGVRLVDLK